MILEVSNPVTCVLFNLPVSDIVNMINRPDGEARCIVFGGDLLRRQGDTNEAFDDVRDAVNPRFVIVCEIRVVVKRHTCTGVNRNSEGA